MMTLIRWTAVGAGLAASILLVTGAATGAVTDPASPSYEVKSRLLDSYQVKSKHLANGETTIDCDAGQVATGGGVGVDSPFDSYVARSEPTQNGGLPTGWKGTLITKAGAPSSGAIYVICVR